MSSCGNDVQQPTSTTTLVSTTARLDDSAKTIISPSVSKTIVATAVANRNYNTMHNNSTAAQPPRQSIQQCLQQQYTQLQHQSQQMKSDLQNQSQHYQQDLPKEIQQYPQNTQNQQQLYQQPNTNCYEPAQNTNKKSNTATPARKTVHWHQDSCTDKQQQCNQPAIVSLLGPRFERSAGGSVSTTVNDNTDEISPANSSSSELKDKFYQSPQTPPNQLQPAQIQQMAMNNVTNYYDEMDAEIMQELQIGASAYQNKANFIKLPDSGNVKIPAMPRYQPLPLRAKDIREQHQLREISEQELAPVPHQQLQQSQLQQKQEPNISGDIVRNEMKREIINPDGSRDIWYANGNVKKISTNGMVIRMLYFNKDIKETNINEGTVKYYYANTNTWHTTYLDGLEVIEFPSGQVEHHHPNGMIEIHYPNNSVKFLNLPEEQDKLEEWRFADGSTVIQKRNGDRVLIMPNGQKETHSKDTKRREYPDGTVKIVYTDGRQETRYSNGRVRLKDKDGKLIIDSMANSEEA